MRRNPLPSGRTWIRGQIRSASVASVRWPFDPRRPLENQTMPTSPIMLSEFSTSPPRRSQRRKVVLYNPLAVFFTMPLALLAIGSHLDPARYEVVIIDGRLEADPVAAVRAHLDDALCLGVTVLTGAPIRDAIRISQASRAYRPDLPIVWGGWHPSMFGKE